MTNRFAMLFVSFALTALDLSAGVNSWTTNGPEGAAISVIAIAASEPATLYTLGSGGVFKSIDAGLNWIAAGSGLENPSITYLTVDPANAPIAYATSRESLFRTTDGGGTWRAMPGFPAPITGIAVDPSAAASSRQVGVGPDGNQGC